MNGRVDVGDGSPTATPEAELAFFQADYDGCWCHDCDVTVIAAAIEAGAPGWTRIMRRMNLCPDCGNKRCPKSTNHDYACTGSNEPGQAGSQYGGRS